MRHIEGTDHLQDGNGRSVGADGASEFTIEPTAGGSLMGSLEKGNEKFAVLLKAADLRSLVQYLMQAGADMGKLPGVPGALRTAFVSRDFKNRPYTWRNPGLYFLADRVVTQMSLSELLARIRDRDSSIQDLLS